MLKIPFLLIVLFAVCLNVQGRSQTLNHGQFIHLSNAQKDEFVIKIMELVVELESRYQREVKVSGYSQERFEKYTKLLNHLSSFFINSAHAAREELTWAKHAENFIELMNSAPGERCVYAGWASRVRMQSVPKPGGGTERRNVCVHPKYVAGGTTPPEALAYQDAANCSGNNNISCNPAIFGYKQESSKSLFCVKAGLNDSENSSLACMRSALEVSAPNTDSKDDRLAFLRSNLVANPTAFEGVQKFIYKTCVCDSTPTNINNDYHAYMVPHRTCYGMMQMIGTTLTCEEITGLNNTDKDFFQKLSEFTTNEITEQVTSRADRSGIDQLYRNFLGGYKTTAEYQQLCPPSGTPNTQDNTPDTTNNGGGSNAAKTYTCLKAICSEGAEAAVTCTYEVAETGSTTPVSPTPSTVVVGEITKESTSISIKATIAEQEYPLTCAVEAPATPEDTTDPTPDMPQIRLSLGTKANTTQVVIATTTPEELGDYKISWYREGFPGAEATSIISEPNDKKEITEDRKATVYKTCAKLVLGENSSAPSCQDIPAMDIPTVVPPPNMGGQQQPPQPPPRGSSNTSAIGIR